MTVKRETYSAWGTLIDTRNVELTVSKTFKQYAFHLGVELEKGQRSFTVEIGNQKIRYTRL